MKLPKIFKWRVNLIQQGYDLGWEHGYEAGMEENQKQIMDKVNKFIHDIDWLKEDPYTRKEIIEAIKKHEPDLEPVGWEQLSKSVVRRVAIENSGNLEDLRNP